MVAIAAVYLLVVRLLDVNEREPLWSIGLLFSLGVASALLLRLVVASPTLELAVLRGAAWKEAAKLLALLAGASMLAAVGRWRGWCELNDPMDGLVYGMAAGLGFATAETGLRLLTTSSSVLAAVGGGHPLGRSALVGLAEGVCGAVTGAGFGVAAQSGRRLVRIACPLAAAGIAVLLHAAWHELAYGNALAGHTAAVRGGIALALPVLCVLAIAVRSLAAERRAIAEELLDEAAGGTVSASELALLRQPARRQLAYLAEIGRGRFARARHLAALHNRQVQLALTKRRVRRGGGDDELRAQVARLRTAVGSAREAVG